MQRSMATMNKKQQKTVDDLTARVELCREFMNDWLIFNQIQTAYPKQEANKAQLEAQFLKIKSKLAREHRVLKEKLQQDYNIDQNVMNIIAGATSLESIYAQSEVSIKKLQTEWHRAFISINETLGVIEDKKARAEAGEKVFMMPGAGGGIPGGGGMSDKKRKTLIIVAIVVAVILAILFVPVPPFVTIKNMYIKAMQDFGIISRTGTTL
jgi:hypothetical protein